MIEPAASLGELLTNLQRFIMTHGSDLPEFTRNAVLEHSNHPSPVDRIVNTAEALYAIKGDLPKEGRDLAAQMAQFAAVNGFHGMTDRGQQMALAMNRIGGYAAPAGTSWPAAEEDPEPLAQFVEPAPEEEAPPVDDDEGGEPAPPAGE